MKKIFAIAGIAAGFALLFLFDVISLGLVPEAEAIAGVRRRTARRTAVVVGSSSAAAASSSQQQVAAGDEFVVKGADDLLLGVLIEIDDHVATNDRVHCAE